MYLQCKVDLTFCQDFLKLTKVTDIHLIKSMRNKQLGYIVSVALIFGLIGLIIGQFVTIPKLKADMDDKFPTPFEAVVDPTQKDPVWVSLRVNTIKDNAFTCPNGSTPTYEMPFYQVVDDREIVRAGIRQDLINDPLKVVTTKTRFFTYGKRLEFTTKKVDNAIIAKNTAHFSRIKTLKRAALWQHFDTSYSGQPLNYIPLEKDMVGPLERGNDLPLLEDINLCTSVAPTPPPGT